MHNFQTMQPCTRCPHQYTVTLLGKFSGTCSSIRLHQCKYHACTVCTFEYSFIARSSREKKEKGPGSEVGYVLDDVSIALLHLSSNVITLRSLSHLRPNVITFRNLLHLRSVITLRSLVTLLSKFSGTRSSLRLHQCKYHTCTACASVQWFYNQHTFKGVWSIIWLSLTLLIKLWKTADKLLQGWSWREDVFTPSQSMVDVGLLRLLVDQHIMPCPACPSQPEAKDL